MLKIWSKQLLYIKPDPTPYLMASRNAILGCGLGNRLIYTQSAQILSNTIENQHSENLKFRIEFLLNKQAITSEYTMLLSVPGLVEFWSFGNKLAVRVPWLNTMNCIDITAFSEGMNNVAFYGDGEYIRLSVNQHVYRLQNKAEYVPILLYSNFARDRYLSLSASKFDLSADNWRFGICIYSPRASVARTNYLLGPYSGYYGLGMAAEFQYDSTGYYHLGWGLSSNNSSWNMGWIQDNTYNFAPSSWYWLLWQRTGSSYKCYVSTDALEYTLYTSTEVSGTPYHNANATLQLGNTANNSSYPWDGGIGITDTFFEKNGDLIFDGSTAVAGTDYTVNGALTSGTYYRTIYVYPEIATGALAVYKGTNYITAIQANIME